MNRNDYVLVWVEKEKVANPPQLVYCSLCRVSYKGTHCPIKQSRCTKSSSDYNAYNNKKHIVIATQDECKGKQYDCPKLCDTCVLPNTYPLIKILPKF